MIYKLFYFFTLHDYWQRNENVYNGSCNKRSKQKPKGKLLLLQRLFILVWSLILLGENLYEIKSLWEEVKSSFYCVVSIILYCIFRFVTKGK
jgi:hypothetical protein